MKRKSWFLLMTGAAVISLSYLLLWPVDIEPARWNPPQALPWSEYPVKAPVSSLEIIPTGTFGNGPEDLLFDKQDALLTTLESGKIIRFLPGNNQPVVVANTQGRPLGMAWDTDGSLLVADATAGLLHVDSLGEIETLVAFDQSKGLTFFNELVISSDRKIYFTTSSNRSGPMEFTSDLLEHQARGSLWVYDLPSKELTLLRDSLNFANGIVLWPDEQSLIFAETSMYRLMRYWIAGPKAGQLETWAENLPGFPDNLSWGTHHTLWVALPNPRNPLLDQLLPYPFLRKIVYRLPDSFQPKPVRNALVAGFDTLGRMQVCYRDTSGRFGLVTSAVEQKGHLYLGSLSKSGFGIWEIAPR